MRFEEFGALVARYEVEAAADPQGYVKRVVRLAWLGRLYIIGALIALVVGLFASLLLGAASVWGMILVLSAIGYAIRSILRAFFARGGGQHEPGRLLTREEAPGLFKALDELGGRVDSVELVPEFNAAMAYIPRLGLLGWPRHHLVVGMSLLLSLSEQEARAVLAHELGHMTGDHTRKASWLYGQRIVWRRLQEEGFSDELSRSILKPFWDKIQPKFDAMSFVLSRLQEYEADEAAARATSYDEAANALMRVHVDERWLDANFWHVLRRDHHLYDEPPRDVYTQIARLFCEERDAAQMEALRAQALAEETGLVDTHPCLRERLAALGRDGRGGLVATQRSAASAWFKSLPEELARLDAEAFAQLSPRWGAQRAELLRQRRLLEELERGGEEGDLEGASELVRSRIYGALRWKQGEDREAALVSLREHVERFPEDARGHLNLGFAQLSLGDEGGVERMREGARRDVRLGGEIGEAIIAYYLERGELAKADIWRDKLNKWVQDMQMMRFHWIDIGDDTPLTECDLSPAQQAKILECLAPFSKLRHVWIARKAEPPHFPDEPVLFVAFVTGFYSLGPDHVLEQQVWDAMPVSGGLVVRDLTPWSTRALRKRLEQLEDAALF